MAGRVEESVWEERREWIGRQEESGLSVAQFCRDNSRFAKLSGQSHIGTGKVVALSIFDFLSVPLANWP